MPTLRHRTDNPSNLKTDDRRHFVAARGHQAAAARLTPVRMQLPHLRRRHGCDVEAGGHGLTGTQTDERPRSIAAPSMAGQAVPQGPRHPAEPFAQFGRPPLGRVVSTLHLLLCAIDQGKGFVGFAEEGAHAI